MKIGDSQNRKRERSISIDPEISNMLHHLNRPDETMLLSPKLKKFEYDNSLQELPLLDYKEFNNKAYCFVDNILAHDGSNLVHELDFIKEHNISLRVVTEILLRKSVQNMPHKEWSSMNDLKKKEYVNEALENILNVLDFKDNELYKKYIKQDVKNKIPLKTLEADHLVAKKDIIVHRVRSKEFKYVENSHIDYHYPKNLQFENIYFPNKLKNIDKYEEWFKTAECNNKNEFNSALSVILDYSSIKGDCEIFAVSFLLNQKAPEEKCCGSDLKENITKFTKSIVDAKQIDRNACKTIIAYDDSARIDFQDEHDKNLYNHYSVSAENGFWLSKRGTFGSVCLLADPAVDEGYTYDKIVAQFTAKDSATELAGVPLDKIYEYLDYPGNSININCDNHSNSGSASTASNLLAPKVHDSGTDSEDNSDSDNHSHSESASTASLILDPRGYDSELNPRGYDSETDSQDDIPRAINLRHE